ncbi:glycosyl hydrolase family 61-domain-containing protein [Coprinopsis sp. MPI-PUGE-AT-0042]|nr:glycosyl hydrolase family 61-domain-containing protein [Coprinopsis sp. MPI-PUGE-AT-0042]
MQFFKALGFALLLAQLSFAHFSIFGVWINGKWQGDGREIYERTKYHIGMNAPVRNVDWSYIACHTFGNREKPRYLEVKAGDTVAPEWFWSARGDFQTQNHLGPVLVYMAPSVSTGPNTPQIWTKLFHYGYNATDKLWADQYFRKDPIPTKGHHFVKIPNVPAGNYLLRFEVIALHEAARINGAQHYPSCIQVRVTTSGSKSLPGGVSFPGTYIPGQPGIMWPPAGNSTADPAKYPLPGGPVWEGSPGGGIYGVHA